MTRLTSSLLLVLTAHMVSACEQNVRYVAPTPVIAVSTSTITDAEAR